VGGWFGHRQRVKNAQGRAERLRNECKEMGGLSRGRLLRGGSHRPTRSPGRSPSWPPSQPWLVIRHGRSVAAGKGPEVKGSLRGAACAIPRQPWPRVGEHLQPPAQTVNHNQEQRHTNYVGRERR
jgi:hypothetical protein